MRATRLTVAAALAWSLLIPAMALAQRQGGPPTRPARESAPVDLTGYWVSYVTEDWRYRMVTPPKGDYRRVPVTTAALPLINGWDPAADERAGNQCKSYGAAALMRMPGRLHITWEDAETLRLDADAGTQTRLFRFVAAASPSGAPSWQGESAARWDRPAATNAGGSLHVVTTNLREGYLRRNGVPYSARTTVTEDFDLAPQPGGGQLLVVTTVVEDPVYLARPFVVSSHFKKEADGSKWDPTPCSATW
jgi:hypothetical protein